MPVPTRVIATLAACAAGAGLALALAAAPAAGAARPAAHPRPVLLAGHRVVHTPPALDRHVVGAQHGARPQHAGRLNASSTNWSGYSAESGGYQTTSTAWTEPSVTCAAGENSAASFWIGLDGDGSDTVEQTGSDADCNDGTPTYYAWYEFYNNADPAGTPSYSYSNPVSPGDRFTATSTSDGGGNYTETITDSTQNWSQTTHGTDAGSEASAEVIAEAPSQIDGSGNISRVPLSNFGSVDFSNSTIDGASFDNDPALVSIEMTGDSGQVDASPSGISDGAFTVTWENSD